QKFIYQPIPKVMQLKQMLDERNLSPYIEVDGGIGLHNAEKVLQAGANVLVAGNAVLGAADPLHVISSLKAIGKDLFKNIPA
ncbi:MAG: ribulose-phosphate 3-epimerase, partial [Bacteroidota bacterium]|nr:ribulose-phosphate 3-epimerase [Bacteroidota bacterium]